MTGARVLGQPNGVLSQLPVASGQYAQVRMTLPDGSCYGPVDAPDLGTLAQSEQAQVRSDALVLSFVKLEHVLRSRALLSRDATVADALNQAIDNRWIQADRRLWHALRQRNSYAHQGVRPDARAVAEAVDAIARVVKQLLVACSTPGCPGASSFRCEFCSEEPNLYCSECFYRANGRECSGCLAAICRTCLDSARSVLVRAVASQPPGLRLHPGIDARTGRRVGPPPMEIPMVAWACDLCGVALCRACQATKKIDPRIDEIIFPEEPCQLNRILCDQCEDAQIEFDEPQNDHTESDRP